MRSASLFTADGQGRPSAGRARDGGSQADGQGRLSDGRARDGESQAARHTCVLLLLLWCGMAGLIAPVAAHGVSSCTEPSCHGDKVGLHPREMECTGCHVPTVGLQHPDTTGSRAFSYPAKEPCLECHGEVTDYRFLHPPVAAGQCRICHQPHSPNPKFQRTADTRAQCLACHLDLLPENNTFFHGPLQQGQCIPCHNPHGAAYPNLLPASFTIEQFSAYSDEAFQFCFTCHNKRLLQFPSTSYATDFRDGEWNLHYLHVNRKTRGKNCRLCHEIHASQTPKLLAATVLLGNWAMPVNFTKTPSGGSCRPGCHDEKKYDRQSPRQAPPAAEGVAD